VVAHVQEEGTQVTKLRGDEAKKRLIWLRVRDLRCALHDKGQPGWNMCQRCTFVKQTIAAALWKLTIKQIKGQAFPGGTQS